MCSQTVLPAIYFWVGICIRDEPVDGTQHQIYAWTPSGGRRTFCLFGLDVLQGFWPYHCITCSWAAFIALPPAHSSCCYFCPWQCGKLMLWIYFLMAEQRKPAHSCSGKSHCPSWALVYCLAAHLLLQVLKVVSELQSLFYAVWDNLLCCLDSHLTSATHERSIHLCRNLPLILLSLKKFLGDLGRATGEGPGKILLPVFMLNFLVSGSSGLVRKKYANVLWDTIRRWWLSSSLMRRARCPPSESHLEQNRKITFFYVQLVKIKCYLSS